MKSADQRGIDDDLALCVYLLEFMAIVSNLTLFHLMLLQGPPATQLFINAFYWLITELLIWVFDDGLPLVAKKIISTSR